jgi:cation:H+ antiporter
MILSFVLLLVGFVVLVYGADKLVDAASGLAINYGIPNIVIGLTIVAFGTSAPEFVVNVFASISGSSDIVMGNILGSNIFNVLGILGVCTLIYPLTVKSSTTWIEIPMAFLAAIMVLILSSDFLLNSGSNNFLSMGDGLVLLMFFIVFIVYNITVSMKPGEKTDSVEISKYTTGQAVLWILVGLGGLILGGKLIVDNAVELALSFGLSERVIGLTIVSIGTSMPELATSVAAVRKKKLDIAIGNVVGSNIFNIFFILGISATILPVPISEPNFTDIWMNILGGLLLFVFIFTGKGRKLEKWEGVLMLVLYIAYLVALVLDL